MSDLASYLQIKERPKKREAEDEFLRIASVLLQQNEWINIIDLPSLSLRGFQSLERFQQYLPVARYLAYEKDPVIFRQIMGYGTQLERSGYIYIDVQNKDVISEMSDKKVPHCPEGIHLFNMDFCDAITPMYRVFQLVHGIQRQMAARAVVLLTFSPRGFSPSSASSTITYAFEQTLRDLYQIKIIHQEERGYRDTAPMKTRLYGLERS